MEMQGYSLKGAIPIFVEKESVVSRVKKSFHDKNYTYRDAILLFPIEAGIIRFTWKIDLV